MPPPGWAKTTTTFCTGLSAAIIMYHMRPFNLVFEARIGRGSDVDRLWRGKYCRAEARLTETYISVVDSSHCSYDGKQGENSVCMWNYILSTCTLNWKKRPLRKACSNPPPVFRGLIVFGGGTYTERYVPPCILHVVLSLGTAFLARYTVYLLCSD